MTERHAREMCPAAPHRQRGCAGLRCALGDAMTEPGDPDSIWQYRPEADCLGIVGHDYSADRRGSDFIYMGDHVLWWPRCEMTGCKHFICVGRSRSLCSPHCDEMGVP